MPVLGLPAVIAYKPLVRNMGGVPTRLVNAAVSRATTIWISRSKSTVCMIQPKHAVTFDEVIKETKAGTFGDIEVARSLASEC